MHAACMYSVRGWYHSIIIVAAPRTQEAFEEKVTHEYEQRRSNKFEIESGYYTDQMMADELKFTRP